MHSSLIFTAVLALGASAAPTTPSGYGPKGQVPFKFPLKDGFPNTKVPSAALTKIEKAAHGTLPNGPLPSKIGDTTATDFQVIAANEIFEVAFFTSLINNITDGTYKVSKGYEKATVLKALHAIQSQEKLHYLGANALLSTAGRTPIQPCEYVFPVDNFDDAIALASTFTDVVLGTLAGANVDFAKDGDSAVVPLVGSIIGQEAEQDGFYRALGGKIPSALPFLTGAAGPFAYSAINQLFIVPGSCPNANVIKAPIFPPLTVASIVHKPKDQTAKFKVTGTTAAALANSYVVYVNQQNVPIVEKIQSPKQSGNAVTFSALFPGAKNLMNGLTIAAVTNSPGPFADVNAVAAATKYGPGLIEIN